MVVDQHTRGGLERMLSVHVAALTMLGALIVGLRHEAPWLPAVTAIAALASVMLTDWLAVVRLNRWVANPINLLAVAWSLRNFWEFSSEEKLMAIGSMLCLLQMSLLFQEKTARIYWHLVVLSVLQVVVAAALDLGPTFVPLLVVFLAVGLGSLALLCAYRETTRIATTQGKVDRWWRAILATMARYRSRFASSFGPKGTRIPPPRKDAPLSYAEQLAKVLLAQPVVDSKKVAYASTIAQSLNTRLIAREVAMLTTVTMLFAVVFFYATPRLRDGFSPGGFLFGGATMGFRSEVRLQRKGRIHLSGRPVMRVKLSQVLDHRSVELIGEPYFHGAILPEYVTDEEGSRWLRSQSTAGGFRRRGILPSIVQTTRTLVRQDIAVESGVTSRFAIQPTQPIEGATSVYGAARGGNERVQQQRYTWATPAILNKRQVLAIPNPNRRRNEEEETAFREEINTASRFPAERFSQLAQIAAEVLTQNQLANGRALDKAVALERHFLMPGQYQYSLNLNLSADEKIDPIEDFVANSRSGNCEYFASALAMMLRSQGIPARLVRGYKGGTFNTVGRYYLVQERDAHSWVEAWMPNEAVPTDEVAGAPSEGGLWYRFDPTPGRSNQLTLEQPGVGSQLAQAFDYVELLWRDYVLSLNTARQDEIVYDPLTARAGALPQWLEMRGIRRRLRQASAALGLNSAPQGSRGARVFEGSVAVAVIISLLAMAAASYGVRLAWTATNQRRRLRRTSAVAPPIFYQRLEKALTRLPITRKSSETPWEMAAMASKRLALIAEGSDVAALPERLVSAYYRLRFGKGRLDKIESEAIEQALQEIELAVQRAR